MPADHGRHPGQRFLAWMWWGPLRRILEGTARRWMGTDGKVLSGPLRGAEISAGLAQRLGVYEYPAQRLLWEAIAPGDCVFDVGSHGGFFTLIASRKVGSEGHVVACEPNPAILPVLRANLERNSVSNVDVVEAAVTDRNGTVHLAANSTRPTTEACLVGEDDAGAMAIDGISLDTLATNFEPPAIIKVDVEGHAAEVLRGGLGLLADTKPPRCLIELHSLDEESECLRILEGWSMTPLPALSPSRPAYPRHVLFHKPGTLGSGHDGPSTA